MMRLDPYRFRRPPSDCGIYSIDVALGIPPVVIEGTFAGGEYIEIELTPADDGNRHRMMIVTVAMEAGSNFSGKITGATYGGNAVDYWSEDLADTTGNGGLYKYLVVAIRVDEQERANNILRLEFSQAFPELEYAAYGLTFANVGDIIWTKDPLYPAAYGAPDTTGLESVLTFSTLFSRVTSPTWNAYLAYPDEVALLRAASLEIDTVIAVSEFAVSPGYLNETESMSWNLVGLNTSGMVGMLLGSICDLEEEGD